MQVDINIQEAIGAIDWATMSVFEIAENVELLIVRFKNDETRACADICKELYANDAITCAEAIEERLI